MNFIPVITATVVVGAVGLVIGILLGVAGQVFAVKLDEKEVAIRAALPGNNCGACGYPGCDGLAKAIFNGEAPYDTCPVGGQTSAEAIKRILEKGVPDPDSEGGAVEAAMAVSAGAATPEEAAASAEKAAQAAKAEPPKKRPVRKAHPAKPEDCVACHICENSCKFDAVHVPDDRPEIDESKCIGCGLCVRECPRDVLEIVVSEG
ncbi:MAG: RnfABCDGE type electron transport complex subunit B [Lachnospiraceae bacterium]|nr:RnfABCDGE type electron transport complex subunit B [Lachnospiraceae bacterium]